MTRTPAPGAPVVPDDVVARFRAAAPVLTADAAGLVTLGRRRRHVRRLAAGALAAVVVAGAAGAAVGMLRGPATPPADGDVEPSPVEVLGSREGLPAGVPVEFAGPVGVLVAPDGRLHVWTSGSSSCPTLPRTVGVADGAVVVEVGTDPADGPACTADLVVATTVIAPPPTVPLSPPPPVEVRDATSGAVLATSSDVPEGLDPVTVLEVRAGWPAWLTYPDSALGTGQGTEPGTVDVWTAGTTDCPAVPVARLVGDAGFVTWATQAPEGSACTGDPVLTTWVLAAPDDWDPAEQRTGVGPLVQWGSDRGPQLIGEAIRCAGVDATWCAMDLWLAGSLEAAGYPSGDGNPASGVVARSASVGSGPVWATLEHLDDAKGSDEILSTTPVGDLTVAHGTGKDTPVVSWFDCGAYRFSFVPESDTGPAGVADTARVAEAVAAAVGTCPADDAALVARFAQEMGSPAP